MSKATARHAWAFTPRFRAGASGWRSNPAIERIKEAVTEIKAADRKAPLLAAEGSVLFLRTVSSALRNVDSSSAAIGSAVNRAIEALVPIIAQAPAMVLPAGTGSAGARDGAMGYWPCLVESGGRTVRPHSHLRLVPVRTLRTERVDDPLAPLADYVDCSIM
jgi:hypothetical protein